jgi:TPR repeat protein
MMRRLFAGLLGGLAMAAVAAPQHQQQQQQRSAFDAGRMYRHGDGVTRDSARAFALIEQAGRQGDCAAMFTLSNMLEAGEGTRRDRAAAHKWLEAAAELECPQALQQLALYLQDGLMGYEADRVRAAQLMRLAAHAVKH